MLGMTTGDLRTFSNYLAKDKLALPTMLVSLASSLVFPSIHNPNEPACQDAGLSIRQLQERIVFNIMFCVFI